MEPDRLLAEYRAHLTDGDSEDDVIVRPLDALRQSSSSGRAASQTLGKQTTVACCVQWRLIVRVLPCVCSVAVVCARRTTNGNRWLPRHDMCCKLLLLNTIAGVDMWIPVVRHAVRESACADTQAFCGGGAVVRWCVRPPLPFTGQAVLAIKTLPWKTIQQACACATDRSVNSTSPV